MSNNYDETTTGLNIYRGFFGEGAMEEKKESQKSFFSLQPPQKRYNYCGDFSPYINFISSQGENSHIKLNLSAENSLDDEPMDWEEEAQIEKEMEEERQKREEEEKKNRNKKKSSRKKKK